MQRKNSILKIYPQTKRGAFAMIMAIFVIIIISTIMALSLSLTTQTSKRTTDIYLYEQAELIAKSAVELAMLSIAQSGACTTIAPYTIDNIYNINVDLKYIYANPSPCSTSLTYFQIATPEQNGSVLMDVTVSINDTSVTTEPIRYFRRSIQKL